MKLILMYWVYLLVVIVSVGLGFFLRMVLMTRTRRNLEIKIKTQLNEAQRKSEHIVREADITAKDLAVKGKMEVEAEAKARRRELQEIEKRLQGREETLDKKFEILDSKEHALGQMEKDVYHREKALDQEKEKVANLHEETKRKLEQISGMTAEEAKKTLLNQMLSEAKHEAAKSIKQIEEQAKEEADKRAKYIVSIAIERLAGEHVQEASVSVVNLPSDDMKGRIIGREGRNIRAIEALTGCDLIIDDTPGAVILASHNPIRREVGRITLERLLADGRIHPARVEEMVEKVTKEVEKIVYEAGGQATFELDLHGVNPELIKLLGALKFRFSYAQNVLRHSIESSFIAGMMAAELGVNVKKARRAALLHDVGKAVTHEVEGAHAVIGAEYCKKYGEAEDIVHAIEAHHEDIPQEFILDHLVSAADAISGARPGARMEVVETYVKRLEDLENIATSFNHIEKAYAIQAGRELRVLVQPDHVTDMEASVLSKDIAKKIESELTYPGKIKVTVVRETRSVEFAK